MSVFLWAGALVLAYVALKRAFRRACAPEVTQPQEPLDIAIEDSFPASDPPSHTGSHI
jgi:hypothetical protein